MDYITRLIYYIFAVEGSGPTCMKKSSKGTMPMSALSAGKLSASYKDRMYTLAIDRVWDYRRRILNRAKRSADIDQHNEPKWGG
jgi:hypothetical protein